MLLKSLKTVLFFILLPTFAENVDHIVFFNEQEVLKQYPEYNALVKKLEAASKKFHEKEQELTKLASQRAREIENMKKNLASVSKTDVSKSAGLVQKIETATKKAQMEINKLREELIKIQKQGAELDKQMQQWGYKYSKKAEKALTNMIKDDNNIKVVIGWPSGRIMYMQPGLNRTKQMIKALEEIENQKSN